MGNFREVIKLARQEAKFLAAAAGIALYEALMDKFESGMYERTITARFDDVKTWLLDLIGQVIAKQISEVAAVQATGPFPIKNQRA